MPEAYLLNERRVDPRFDIKIPIIFKVLDHPKAMNIHDRGRKEIHHPTLNVSLGGMYIVAGHELEEGNILSFDIAVPGLAKKLKAMAEVVWSNEMGGGIRFLSMKDGDLNAFKTYLARASSDD